MRLKLKISFFLFFSFTIKFFIDINILTKCRKSKNLLPSQISLITYYVKNKNRTNKVHFDETILIPVCRLSINNLIAYTTKHKHPFFYRNAHLVDSSSKSPYWAKMDVVQHYLKAGYEWVVWTDVDVLFMDTGQSLVDGWLGAASINHHIALVLECNMQNSWKYGGVRSGFFAIRNSIKGASFLEAWKNMYSNFRNNFNPEQEALEKLAGQSQWKKFIFISPPTRLHTYPWCYKNQIGVLKRIKTLSIHFPGHSKNEMKEFSKKSDLYNDTLMDIQLI